MNIYVVPNDCPVRDDLLKDGPLIFGKVIKEEELASFTKFDWTCAGCTVGTGITEEPCLARKCKMGGYPGDDKS